MNARYTSLTRVLLGALVAATSACTSLHSVSVNGVPRDRSRPVTASESNTAFLGIHFDNDFVDDLPRKLRAQCPSGKVTGVFTKHESSWYVLVQTRRVRVQGYCVHEPQGEPRVAERSARSLLQANAASEASP